MYIHITMATPYPSLPGRRSVPRRPLSCWSTALGCGIATI